MTILEKIIFNPYLPYDEFIPDGEPHVFGDRVYLFGSHDRRDGTFYCMDDYVTWSAPVSDLSQWRCEGVIYKKSQDPKNPDGSKKLYAPDVCQGPDGRFYLYYALSCRVWAEQEICAAVAERPEGPYEYLGVVSKSDGTKLDTTIPYDPAILCDKDGRVWLYFGFAPHFPMQGQPIPDSHGCYVVEIEPDMVTCKGEPKLILPAKKYAAGTEFEEEPFFEAASIRRIGDQYYLIYCSSATATLAYATADKPDGPYHYGGVVISSVDAGISDHPRNPIANIHGGMEQINGHWYVFYHRHTNGTQFSRQACAEQIEIDPYGRIKQAECTSFGLSGGTAPAMGYYPAYIACNLYQGQGGTFLKFGPRNAPGPYMILDGEAALISHITDLGLVGFRYFTFGGALTLQLTLRGTGKGLVQVSVSDDEVCIAQAEFEPEQNWQTVSIQLPELTGDLPLLLRFKGEIEWEMKEINFV